MNEVKKLNINNEKLSLCMLVMNQAELLENILSKICQEFFQIIIVNNNSTDNTSEVIRKYSGVEILYEDDEWDKGRNLYIDAVKEGWILVLDADEEINVKNIQAIKKKIANTNDDIFAYKIPRIDFLGEGKWVEVLNNRLFRKDKRIFYDDRVVHSTISNSLLKDKKYTDINYEVNFVHWAGIFEQSLKEGKRERYIQVLENHLKNNIDLFGSTYRLALECFAIGNYKDCEKLLEQSLSYEASNLIYKKRPLMYMALLYIAQHRFEQAIKLLLDLKKQASNNIEIAYICIYLAKISHLENNKESLIFYLKEALLLLPYSPLCHLNYAIATQIIDEKKIHTKRAVSLLPDLLNPVIYQIGDKNNIFRIQDMGIFDADTIKNTIERFL